MNQIEKRIYERRLQEISQKLDKKTKREQRYLCDYKQWSKAGNQLRKKLRKENKTVKINDNTNSAIYMAIKLRFQGRKKGIWTWEKILGYTVDELIQHLEQQFNSKMSWDNYGTYWVIDHIIPKRYFVFDSTEDEEFKKCWALDNLRPLPKKLNYYNVEKKELDKRFKTITKKKVK